MNQRRPLMSLVVNNHNYGKYLAQCLDSLLGQENAGVNEIIVVDDGSTDHSREILGHYSRFGVKTIYKSNAGQASAFNRGAEVASGDLVWFIDSDDELLPHASRIALREWIPGTAFLQCGLRLIDEESRDIGVYPGVESLEHGDLWGKALTRPKSRSFVHSPTTGLVFSRRALNSALPMPERSWRVNADGLLVLRVSRFGHTQVIREYLGSYRLHGENAWASVLFDETQNVSARKVRLLSHDADRREALADFIGSGRALDWEVFQSERMRSEARWLRDLALLIESESDKSDPVEEMLAFFERRSLGLLPQRRNPPPPEHFDVWQNIQRNTVYRTLDWPNNCNWAHGFGLSPWTEHHGVARSTSRLSGLRIRPEWPHGGVAHFLVMAAERHSEGIKLAVFVDGVRQTEAVVQGLTRISVCLPAGATLNIDFLSTGPWCLLLYACSLVSEPVTPLSFDHVGPEGLDFKSAQHQSMAVSAITNNGGIALASAHGLVLGNVVDISAFANLAMNAEVYAKIRTLSGFGCSWSSRKIVCLGSGEDQGEWLPLSLEVFNETDFSGVALVEKVGRSPNPDGHVLRDPELNMDPDFDPSDGVVELAKEVSDWGNQEARFPSRATPGVVSIHLSLPLAAFEIWSIRPDLQTAFDLTKNWGRLGLFAWLHQEGSKEGYLAGKTNLSSEESALCAVLSVSQSHLGPPLDEAFALRWTASGPQVDEVAPIPIHLALLWTIRQDLRSYAPADDPHWLQKMQWWWNRYGRVEHGLSPGPVTTTMVNFLGRLRRRRNG